MQFFVAFVVVLADACAVAVAVVGLSLITSLLSLLLGSIFAAIVSKAVATISQDEQKNMHRFASYG